MQVEPADTAPVATGLDPTSSGTSVEDSAALFDAIESQGDTRHAPRRRQAATDDDHGAPVHDDTRDDDRANGNSSPDDTADPQQLQNDDEDDEWPEDLRGRKFRRTINGERVEIDIGELERGYHRQADYTRKMQEVATHRQAFESGVRQTLAQRQQLDQTLNAAYSLIQASMPQEPDWTALAQNADPRMLQLARIEWEKQQGRLAQVASAIQANQQAGAQEWNQAHAARMQQSFEDMLKANPDWRDPQVRAKGQREIQDYVLSLGFTSDDLKAIVDHRIIGVLRDAARYRAALKAMNERRRNGNQSDVQRTRQVQPAEGGNPQPRQAQRSRAAVQDMNRLQKTGKLDDAARVMERFA